MDINIYYVFNKKIKINLKYLKIRLIKLIDIISLLFLNKYLYKTL